MSDPVAMNGSELDEWVTLREAAEDAGVSVATLRKWYRAESIPSRMEAGPYGPQRVVPLAAVRQRAERAPAPSRGSEGRQSGTSHPPGTTLIPLADLAPLFDRLANAEGRAARAEAEAQFLREQLADRRQKAAEVIPSESVPERGGRRSWWSRRRE